jgi:hypothetical protein
MADKLQLLKTRYLELIRGTERTLAELKRKVAFIDELEKESDGIENGEPAIQGIQSAKEAANATDYTSTGLTEAALDAVRTLGAGNCVTASAVAGYLLGKGFRPKGKNFKISVGTTLKRLAKSDRIQTKSEDGMRLYTISLAEKYK